MLTGECNDTGSRPSSRTSGPGSGRVRRCSREVVASPLAAVPHDLRHAAVSTWLRGGADSSTVAEWAGHSVETLHKIYAKCLDGGDAVARARVQAALGH